MLASRLYLVLPATENVTTQLDVDRERSEVLLSWLDKAT